ncbi:MAG: glycosyltransferase family 39 protein, partial [Deltaproteobacteria bacterium]|nr:glycosyltransferase family 39 protein [Deltaproteobacteria bacterium]
LGALDCVLIYLVARRVFGAAVAAIAGVIAALYAVSIFYDGVLLVTALQTPLNLLLVWLLLRAERSPSFVLWILAGVCLGLSVLARPNVLLLALLVPPWIVFALKDRLQLKRAALAAALFLVGTAAIVLPVTARNHAVGDDAVLVSSQGGVNFYIGNGPDAIGSFRVPQIFPKTRADDPLQQQEAYRAYAEHRTGEQLKPSEVSDFWVDETWDHIGNAPGAWTALLVKKLGLFVNHYEIGNSRDYESSRQFSVVLELPLFGFGVICPLALLGLVVAARRLRRAFLLYAMVVVYAVSLVVFFVLAHYRMPVVPFFVIFAAFGLAWLLERIAHFKAAPVLAAIVGLTAAVAVTQLDLTDEDQARFMVHYNLGNKYRLIGRRDLALAEYERSIDLDSTYISAHHNLALLSEEQPLDVERAIAAWKQVLHLALQRGDRVYIERARRHLHVLERMDR